MLAGNAQGDAIGPQRQLLFAAIKRQRPEDPDERLLQQLFHVRVRAKHSIERGVERTLQLPEQHALRHPIIRHCQPRQRRVPHVPPRRGLWLSREILKLSRSGRVPARPRLLQNGADGRTGHDRHFINCGRRRRIGRSTLASEARGSAAGPIEVA
jgi:hypothetical protein